MDTRDHYKQYFTSRNGAAPQWLRPLRTVGLERFVALGFPTPRLEEWKYTNVAPIARVPFRLAAATALSAAATQAVAGLRPGTGRELVFVNGRYVPALSAPGASLRGLTIDSLAAVAAREPARVEPHLGGFDSDESDAFVALNTAFMEDGAVILVDKGVTVDEPIHLLFVSLPTTDGAQFSCPRNLIVAGESSHITVIESYVGATVGQYLTNAVTEVAVGANAGVAHYKVQREDEAAFHVGRVAARQAADSRFNSLSISLGAALARTDIGSVLGAEGGDCRLDGLYMAGGAQHVDHHTTIDHQRPHCSSRELYKGVLDGRATGVFNGKVYVRPDAQKSDAQQMNKNLLLSETAVVNTKPQLEIFADDVKCSHGATIGRLDDDALFYLRARGIDAATARTLLVYAFANELITRVPVESVRTQLDATVRDRLQHGAANEVGA
jgi:Fe-S cluster assembly protein SufD